MAKKVSIRIPYAIRELVAKLESQLGLHLGVPMNAECPVGPQVAGEEIKGKAILHFPGSHLTLEVVLGMDHEFGQTVGIVGVRGRINFQSAKDARDEAWEWAQTHLEQWIGDDLADCTVRTDETKGRYEADLLFTVGEDGVRWLAANASNRRNGLSVHKWDDESHPRHLKATV